MLATIIAKNVEALKKNIIIFLYTKYRIQNKIDQLPDPLYSIFISSNLFFSQNLVMIWSKRQKILIYFKNELVIIAFK